MKQMILINIKKARDFFSNKLKKKIISNKEGFYMDCNL